MVSAGAVLRCHCPLLKRTERKNPCWQSPIERECGLVAEIGIGREPLELGLGHVPEPWCALGQPLEHGLELQKIERSETGYENQGHLVVEIGDLAEDEQ